MPSLKFQPAYDDLVRKRQNLYDILNQDPKQQQFYNGWMNRLDEFRDKKVGSPTMDPESQQNAVRGNVMRSIDSKASEEIKANTASVGNARVASVNPQISSNSTINNNNTSVMNKRRPMNEEASVIRFMTPILA